jgi:hypothetical protein
MGDVGDRERLARGERLPGEDAVERFDYPERLVADAVNRERDRLGHGPAEVAGVAECGAKV